jgi:hypothetical protein
MGDGYLIELLNLQKFFNLPFPFLFFFFPFLGGEFFGALKVWQNDGEEDGLSFRGAGALSGGKEGRGSDEPRKGGWDVVLGHLLPHAFLRPICLLLPV